MKKILFIIGLFFVSVIFAYSQNDIDEYINIHNNEKTIGIKKITTKKSRFIGESVFVYDEDGFLLQQLYYIDKKLDGDFRYEYVQSDTLLQVKMKNYVNNTNNNYILYVYHYFENNQCNSFNIYHSAESLEVPSTVGYNFIYKNKMLKSYERALYPKREDFPPDKITFFYNEKGQVRQCSYVTEYNNTVDTTLHSYFYDENNHLTDYVIKNNDEKTIFTGVVCWSDAMMNKVHIRYSNFDKQGNWTKSYFVTEKGKVFRSRRKIEYW